MRPDPFAIGTLIAGRYRLESVIGRGGMGVVYRARQGTLERAVALKILRPELLADPSARARFEREGRVASLLAHPSALAIHELGEHEGHAFLAMELVEAPTLRALLDASPKGMPAELAIDLAFKIADLLTAAHRVDLVHRDLKPENVFVVQDAILHAPSALPAGAAGPEAPAELRDPSLGVGARSVRVVDFGLAFRERDPRTGRMTREGVVVGTPAYCSPEQARGGQVGKPTDVYALGCVVHELVTGRPLFGGTEMEVLTKQMYAPPPPLRGAHVPEALAELRAAMLDKRPEARPPMDEVRDRLGGLDPDPARARARARVDGYLGPRASRMVDASPSAPSPRTAGLELAIAGALEPELVVALSAAGLVPFALAEEGSLEGVAAIFAPGASEQSVRALARHGVPVLSDAAPGDLPRLTRLMRAGAADVVPKPVVGAELARRVERLRPRR